MRTLKALLRAAAVALGLFPFSAAAQQVSLPEALAAIEQYNPDLAVVRLLQPLAAADVIAARAYPNPEIELGSGWWRSRAGIAAPTVRAAQSRDPEMRQMLIGVSLPLPLWNRREGQIARAEVAIEAAQAQIGAQRVQLLRELDSAFARAAVARHPP